MSLSKTLASSRALSTSHYNMPPQCCLFNDRGRCRSCAYVRRGKPYSYCTQSNVGRCEIRGIRGSENRGKRADVESTEGTNTASQTNRKHSQCGKLRPMRRNRERWERRYRRPASPLTTKYKIRNYSNPLTTTLPVLKSLPNNIVYQATDAFLPFFTPTKYTNGHSFQGPSQTLNNF